MLSPVNPEALAQLDQALGFSTVWRRGYRGKGVTIAVLDAGMDPPDSALSEYVTDASDFVDQGAEQNLPAGPRRT